MSFSKLKEKLLGKKSEDIKPEDATREAKINVEIEEQNQEKPPVDKKALIMRAILILAIVAIAADIIFNPEKEETQQQEIAQEQLVTQQDLQQAQENAAEINKQKEQADTEQALAQVKQKAEEEARALEEAQRQKEQMLQEKRRQQELLAQQEKVKKEKERLAKEAELKEQKMQEEMEKKYQEELSKVPPVDTEASEPTTPQQEELEKKLGEQLPEEQSSSVIEESKKTEETEVKTYVKLLRNLKIDSGQDLEKPDYLSNGRGLVYDCEAKRWVCLNRVNYLRCARRQKLAIKEKRLPGCVAKDIFYSSEHCSRGQLRKIHEGKEVQDCLKINN